MILNREKLIAIFNILSTSVGNKVMQVADYACFRVDRTNRKLFISSTDYHSFICVDYGDLGLADISDVPEMFLIHFKTLQSILKASTTAEVQLSSQRKADIIRVVTNGKYDLTCYHNTDEFPQSSFQYDEVGKWAVPVIQSAWSKAAIAVSKDVTKIAYQGVNFDGNFVATDNRRMSVATGETAYNGEPILLMPNVGDVLKHCKKEVSVGPNTNKTLFVIVCEEIGMVASVRTIDAKFVDYKMFLGTKTNGNICVVPKNEILGAISRLMIFTDQLYKVVNVKISKLGDGVVLELSVNNKSAGVESITATNYEFTEEREDGVVAEFKYHLDNMLDGITVTDSAEEIHLNFQEDGKLWIEEKNFLYLLTRIQE